MAAGELFCTKSHEGGPHRDEKERERKETVLFPIRLDDAVMDIKTGWPTDIRRSRHIGDFTNWKDHDSFKKAFDRLLKDLGKKD